MSSYSPREVKASVAGYGNAAKEQMQLMVRALLGMTETPEPADAADALAVALCHVQAEQFRARLCGGTTAPRSRTPECAPSLRGARSRGSRSAHRIIEMTRNRFLRQFLCLLAGAWILVPLALANSSSATITYRRVFKSSTPEFIEVKVSDLGKCTFDIRQLDEDADPQPFEVGPDVRKKIFDLTDGPESFRGSKSRHPEKNRQSRTKNFPL